VAARANYKISRKGRGEKTCQKASENSKNGREHENTTKGRVGDGPRARGSGGGKIPTPGTRPRRILKTGDPFLVSLTPREGGFKERKRILPKCRVGGGGGGLREKSYFPRYLEGGRVTLLTKMEKDPEGLSLTGGASY